MLRAFFDQFISPLLQVSMDIAKIQAVFEMLQLKYCASKIGIEKYLHNFIIITRKTTHRCEELHCRTNRRKLRRNEFSQVN